MELLAHYLLFLAKAVTIVVAIGAVVTVIAAAVRQQRHGQQDRLDIESLNERYRHLNETVEEASIGFDSLDRIAATTGPGSFTGLRVGLSAARGIALAAGKPAV
ncbi:MAG: hypothetical protein ABF271_14170, partial [Abyssibacter sp.]